MATLDIKSSVKIWALAKQRETQSTMEVAHGQRHVGNIMNELMLATTEARCEVVIAFATTQLRLPQTTWL
jgi:hypothetical protein